MCQKPTIETVWNLGSSKGIHLLAVLSICLALMTGTRVANGQASLSTLRGTVTDSSGAVVPAAVVVLTEPATGVEVRRQSADSQGNYELIDVKPGTYTLRADAQGFKRYAADDVILASGDVRRIDIPLSIGEATQQVTVMAGAAVIATETGMIGGLFNNQQHEDV